MAIAVSPEWKAAIQGQFRYPAYLRVGLKISPPDLRAAAKATSEYTESITDPGATIDGISAPIAPVATLETDRWIGDGSMYLASENSDMNAPLEWWSDTAIYPSIDFIFNKEYTIPGVSIIWDTETNSWPTSFTLKGYNFDGELIGEHTITDVDSVESYSDIPFENIKKITLVINSWSKPGWRTRITEVLFGLVLNFSNNSITDASLTATCDPLSAELPSLSMKFHIDNYDRTFDPLLVEGYSKYLTERQKVSVQWGFSVDGNAPQWMEAWPMYLSAWSIPSDQPSVSITASSRLSFLDTIYTQGTYNGNPKTFAQLAIEVLQSSNIIQDVTGETPWQLAAPLSQLLTRAPAPREAINVILQLIANATGCLLDNDPATNYVRFRARPENADYVISKSQQLGDPSFEISNRLKSIKIGLRTFSRKSTSEQVYKFSGILAGTTILDVAFNDNVIVTNPQFKATNATIAKVQLFARGALLTVAASPSGADVTIIATGNIVEESTTFITTYSDAHVESGLEVTIDNPLITEMDTLKVVAEVTKNYYLRRKKVIVPYTGYPELETGDILEYKTNYGDFTADTTRLSLEFNGGFSGTIESHVIEEVV